VEEEHAAIISEWLATAEKPVVFTGAGISTESGIPDFRSPGGIWTKFRTVYFDEFLESAAARYEYWQQKSAGHREFATAQPNAGHQMIADWEACGLIHGVITQNIDGLHQMVGNRNVLELHGTARQIACLDCGARYDAEHMVAEFLRTDQVPLCTACGDGRLKHATISFGQALAAEILHSAVTWCESTGLLLAIGSSLVVSPAAELPALAKKSGARLVIINRDTTPLDSQADLVIHMGIGDSLLAIDACRRKTLP